MVEAEEYAGGDVSRDYCVHCARPDGSMQSFEERKAASTAFIVRTQGFDETAAAKLAEDMMRSLPAWAGRFERGEGRDSDV